MGKTLAYKILEKNKQSGILQQGEELTVRVNQTLTQDSTGTMVYLQMEAMGIDSIKTDRSVAYIDHNTLQAGFENADDHQFIQSAAAKYGIVFSKPGNGICHQLHLERFGKPGEVLIGSDSHTPTGGGLGMLAIGSGGLDVAVAMAKGTYNMKAPKVYEVHLTGQLPAWVSAKDVILEVLRNLSVKGGVGYIIEYTGPGVKSLSVTDRATITNMGAELGATTSIFPSDEQTLDFLTRQGRAEDYQPLSADEDAVYDSRLESTCPPWFPWWQSPIARCSCRNCRNFRHESGSGCHRILHKLFLYRSDEGRSHLKRKACSPNVSLVISPGSSNILKMMSENGALGDLIAAGARILEAACGPCIGMGQAPKSGAVSLRTFNRNFQGRCGTMDADVYLVSPETAAVAAITGVVTEPADFDMKAPVISLPDTFANYENYFIYPPEDRTGLSVVMGPNIKPFPINEDLPETLEGSLLLKTGDNITTDDIMPSNAKLLPFRSNIPELSKYCFGTIVPDFKMRAEVAGGGFVIGGDNYGQGSSREHAALVPLYLGVKAVIAKSFARIHKKNLINSGILPLIFKDPTDYDRFSENDELAFESVHGALKGTVKFELVNKTQGFACEVVFEGSERDVDVLMVGGTLNYTKKEIEA